METLVLSTAYEPVARVPWQRAITLLFEGKVEVVDSYEDRFVRSVTLELQVPAVIRHLRSFRRRRRAPIRFSRENVYARDEGRCQYCQTAVPRHAFTYDHVLPRAKGGRTCWENIVVACLACNQKKGHRTPEEAGLRLRRAPVKPAHLDHGLRLVVGWERGVPPSWRQWLTDVRYWHGRLEQDGS